MSLPIIIAKNDFEGLASAILLNVIHSKNIDLLFQKYESDISEITIVNSTIYAVGIKEADSLVSKYDKATVYIFNSFKELYEYCLKEYPNEFKSRKQLRIFCEHAQSYLDWTWQKDQKYYGKNIDELSKYFNKNELAVTIADRILSNLEIVTEIEKQLIVFSKKIITNYIDKKRYYIHETDTHKYAYTFCESNEIELANKLIEYENVDAVILANLNNNIVRIKSKEKNKFEKQILNINGHVNSNGGTVKLSNDAIKKLKAIVFEEIIQDLSEGGI